MIILIFVGCDSSSSSGKNIVTSVSTIQTNSDLAKVAAENAAALEQTIAIQDANNKAQEAALKEFGTGIFGESTFQ
jgi:hypothetical protein